MQIAEFQIEFSYNQFLAYDSEVRLPGNEWTENHTNQGFARRDSSVSFGTLLQFGYAQARVFNDDYVLNKDDERVIKVPFYCPSGNVLIEGPEENRPYVIELEPGHYQLTAAQQANYDDETLSVRLYFLKVDTPLSLSEIIIKDDQLDPSDPLLETCETATY